MKILIFLKSFIKKYIIKFVLYITIAILVSLISLIMPYLTGKFIDILVSSTEVVWVYKLAVYIGVLSFLNLILQYKRDLIHTEINTNIAFDISTNLYEHIKRLPLSYFQNVDSVYLSNRIIEDSNNIIAFFTTNIITIFIELMKVFISISILISINNIIAILSILLIPFFIVLYNIFKRDIYITTKDFREKQNMFFSRVAEQFFNIKFIKINCIYNDMKERLKKSYNILFSSILKYYRINYLFNNFGEGISIFINVFLLLYGGSLVFNKDISIGNFTIINTYFAIIMKSTLYFLTLGNSYQNALISYDRLIELKDIKEETIGKDILFKIESIELKDLSFAYKNNRTIINNFNYLFLKGKIYIIKGQNGTGKTTLLNSIIGLHKELYKGEVFYNSENIDLLNMDIIRRNNIAFLIQEQSLLASTIMDNITIGLEEQIDIIKIDEWCKKLNIYNKIYSLNEGYETKIAEGTTNFSGGEKQKISLVRLFLKNAQVLIFDEPTSALDSNSTVELLKILSEIKKEHIIIIVTHDTEITKYADEIIDIDKYGDLSI